MKLDGYYDVIIVGAGLSGVGTACRLASADPGLAYTVLEGRASLGGTWDLFRYPGVRSDSDMETLCYPFRPWRGARSLAAGADIRSYIAQTAQAFGVDRHIRYKHKVVAADWSSSHARWVLRVVAGDRELRLGCAFMVASTGYFDYERPHAPEWPDQAAFTGEIVHPQFWPEGLACQGRRVVVVGSGATAVTMVPALAAQAEHVTMLQRSPSYVVAWPSHDRFGHRTRRLLPARPAAWLVRSKNIMCTSLAYAYARRRPAETRRIIVAGVRRELGADYDVNRHFGPGYAPWDQRVCVAADGDLFAALRSGRASVVTDEIARFTPGGVALASGATLDADLVVTATGLTVKLLGGISIVVDGRPLELAQRLIYRGAMIEGVPNLAFSFGYMNISWTLRSDLTARFVVRLLRRMRRLRRAVAVPRHAAPELAREPFTTATSGYLRRAAELLPKRGPAPWSSAPGYLRDLGATLGRPLDDGVLVFGHGLHPQAEERAWP